MELKEMELMIDIFTNMSEADFIDKDGDITTSKLYCLDIKDLENVHAFVLGSPQDSGEWDQRRFDEVVGFRINIKK